MGMNSSGAGMSLDYDVVAGARPPRRAAPLATQAELALALLADPHVARRLGLTDHTGLAGQLRPVLGQPSGSPRALGSHAAHVVARVSRDARARQGLHLDPPPRFTGRPSRVLMLEELLDYIADVPRPIAQRRHWPPPPRALRLRRTSPSPRSRGARRRCRPRPAARRRPPRARSPSGCRALARAPPPRIASHPPAPLAARPAPGACRGAAVHPQAPA